MSILSVYKSIPTTISDVFWQKAKLHYLLYKHQREDLADKALKLYKVIENPNYFDFSRNLGKILWAMNFWLKPHFRGSILPLSLPRSCSDKQREGKYEEKRSTQCQGHKSNTSPIGLI